MILKRRSSLFFAFLFACMLALGNTAYGEALVLPGTLTVIEEAAFAGDTSLSSVVLPDGMREIGPRAFAGSSVMEINLPRSIDCIAPDAFADISSPVLIQTELDSFGLQYALANHLDVRADTVCRALVIGQNAYPEGHELNGPVKDAAAIGELISGDFLVTRRDNLTADQILSAIAQTFAGAKDSDISLFYYAGHGKQFADPEKNGSLIGIDYTSFVSPVQLRAVLDGVKGRKIVVIDACYSGGFIGRGGSAQAAIESMSASMIQAFQSEGEVQAASLAADSYLVFAASAGNQRSWETVKGGVFTGTFIESKTSADANGDSVVTVQECYAYTSKRVQEIVSQGNLIQSVQVYPKNCNWFGLFR